MIKKEQINKVFNSAWLVIVIAILLLLKTLFFYNNTIAHTEKIQAETFWGTVSFILVIVCFLNILPKKARLIGTIIVDFLISTLLLGDNIYYTFSNNVLSVAQVTNLQYGGEIAKTLPMVIEFKQIFYFLDIFIILGLLIFTILKIKKEKNEEIQENTEKEITKEETNQEENNSKSFRKKRIFEKISWAIVGIFVFCIIGSNYVEKGKQKSYNKDMQIREATILGYHIYDFVNAFEMKNQAKYKNYEEMKEDYTKLKEQYETKYGMEKYQFKGIVKEKNVIILQLESIQDFVINKEINGKQITPNLNKFLNENIRFTNMHMQSYSTTADSEHSTITSIYPMENGMSFSKYFTNTYDDIFKIFKNANYHTSYMHGNYPYFWNRGNVYGRLNLNELVLKEQFSDISENINGDLSDELLYKQAVQKLKTYNEPFISYIVSASSHTPFVLEGLQDRNKVQIDVGKYSRTYFGNYLEAVNYADYAFGLFIQELKDAELYEDATILVFGDHNGLTMYNEELIDFLKQTDENLTDVDLKLNYTRVAAGIKIPGLENSNLNIEKPVNKLDIKPTLAYLCGVQDGFSLGTNMFASKDFVCLNNERIITSRYYYDEQWYEIKTGEKLEKIDEEILSEYYEYMKTELDISNSVSINNVLFKLSVRTK